jgi:predicted dehydrogenase
MNVGVIGYGYWGPNLVRNFSENGGCKVLAVSDLNPARLAQVQGRYPGLRTTTDADEILTDPKIDIVAIATPVHTHYALAMKALKNGKHVFVEKPITTNLEEARRLTDEAEKRNLTLMVDHTFVYHGAVQLVKRLVDSGRLGEMYYFDSVRVNLGLFQTDVDVLWDLAVHDLSILQYLVGRQPCAVAATGMAHVSGRPVDIAYLTLYYDSFIGHIHANWLAPVKVRRTLIGGSLQMVVYDDLELTEKVKIYDKGITIANDQEEVYKRLISYRTGDMLAPQFDTTEALRVEVQHLLDCVDHGTRPMTDGEAGCGVVEVLEQASRSLLERGRLIELPTRYRMASK